MARARTDVAFLFTAVTLCLPPVHAQDQKPAAPVAAPAVTIVGASVSAGFVDPRPRQDGERNSTVRLRSLLKAFWEGEVEVRDRSDLTTFLDPVRKQIAKIERAFEDRPALLIAIDFPFWFGYGYFPGTAEKQAAARLARLEQGLALLQRFDCPIVVGGFPDMTGADPTMLNPRQIPSQEVLGKLNARLREWAAGRDNIRVFPIVDWLVQAQAGNIALHRDGDDLAMSGLTMSGLDGEQVDAAGAAVVVPATVLMQSDRLHASRLGMALLAHRLAREIGQLFPDGHALRPAVELRELVTVARAEEALEELFEDRAPAAGAGGPQAANSGTRVCSMLSR